MVFLHSKRNPNLDKYHEQRQPREESLFWFMVFERSNNCWIGIRAGSWRRNGQITTSTKNTESEQEMEETNSQSPLQDYTTSPNSTITWGPGVQIHETMGTFPIQNHHTSLSGFCQGILNTTPTPNNLETQSSPKHPH